ncbi:MAG: hypothetical protein J6K17_13075 [Oscillospiraceae bacterium]|nr:hypothetical protein [Oscillospiraceae bacterium]
MKDLLKTSAKIYCDYTIFMNESFELFCENNTLLLRESGVKLNVPQPVIDEMKAVPMSRMDDYALCYQGLARVDKAVNEGIAVIVESFDGVEYSEDYFYKLCEKSDENIIVATNDIQLVTELSDLCGKLNRTDGFLKVVEIEENGMIHRIM